MTRKNPQKYEIKQCSGGILDESQLEGLLEKLPFNFNFAKEETYPWDVSGSYEQAFLEVYHSASVISLYPPNGMRLSCATVTDWDFPLRPDNMMDDCLGLRCCFHPRLSSFGLDVRGQVVGDEIEIDIHKFPIESKDRGYFKI